MGVAKAELRIGERPILEYLQRKLHWPGPTLLVTAPGRQKPSGHEAFEREVSDPVAGLGPLRGLLTAIENCTTELLVVITVDMPGVAHYQLQWLVEQMRRRPEALGMMVRHGQQIEPFPSAWRIDVTQLVRQQMATARRSVQSLIDGSRIFALDEPQNWDPLVWTNLNSPLDVKAFNGSIL